ncbi:MAG TPA: proline--tRNA ligase [Candidatus Azosocius sp. HAIN]
MNNNIYKTSNLFFPTIKETKNNIKSTSHKLMIKAGIIRQTASGIYTLLPLGLLSINKIQFIIKKYLNEINCQEILMPILQPKNLWDESKRWDKYGSQLFNLKDRKNRKFCLGPTHEEIVTDLIRHNIYGYKQFPITLYQIQTKFRDEYRPKFGLIRAREFIMKDAYSFHMNKKCLNYTYNKIRTAYIKIFNLFNLEYKIVIADSGEIGGNLSEEFHIISKTGEDKIAISKKSNFASNVELAIPGYIKKKNLKKLKNKKINIKYNKINIKYKSYKNNSNIKTIKTILLKGKKKKSPIIIIIIKKIYQINSLKLIKNKIIKKPLQIIQNKYINIEKVKDKIPIIIDNSTYNNTNYSQKLNKKNLWKININLLLKNIKINDIRYISNLDISPCGNGYIKIKKGTEVGHIFKLGNKYSTLMKTQINNNNKQSQYIEMGCYGIGISRLLSIIIEQTCDKHGIIFPEIISPFNVIIIPINLKNKIIKEYTINLYKELKDKKIDVIIENRKINIQIILSEIDLIGIPHRIIINEKNLLLNKLEYKSRNSKNIFLLNKNEIFNIIEKNLKKCI